MRILLALTVCIFYQTLAAQEVFDPPKSRAKFVAFRAVAHIQIDGRLTETDWGKCPVATGFLQVEPNQGDSTFFQTDVRILFDAENLYIGAYCRDTIGYAGVRVPDLRRDFDFFTNDLFSVSIDGFYDQRSAMAFQVNPYGALRDLLVFDDRLYDRDWDGVWTAATQVCDTGWTVEIAIPFATLRYNAPDERTKTQSWGIQFTRIVRRENQVTSLPLFPRAYTPYRMSYSGDLIGLMPPPPRLNVRFQPYALQEVRATSNGVSGAPQVGGELKWAITSNDVLDLTLNTDFAQADVDRQVINLSRFSVFFPERRQFFLENASLFALGADNTIQPFFSRRIGLDDFGNPIPIDGGVRYVRRTTSENIGLLLIQTRGDEARNIPLSQFAVARFSQNLGKENRLGAMLNVRQDDATATSPSRINLVTTLDGFWRISPSWSYQAMVSNSQTRGAVGNGFGAYSFLSWSDNAGYIGLVNSIVSPDYNAGTGFVNRQNVVATSLGMYPNFRPDWKPSFIRAFEPDLFINLFHGVADGELQEASIQFSPISITFQSGGSIVFSVQPNWQFPTEPFSPITGVQIAEGTYTFTRIETRLNTDQSAAYSLNFVYSLGGYFDGRLNSIDITLNARPIPHIAISLRWLWNEFYDVGGSRNYRQTHLLVPELRVALNPRLQLIGFYQYNTAINTATLNARLAWEFAPLSFLYLVINDRSPVNNATFAREEQGILKINYIHQF
ncbi:MAG: DUF5916 domain-containing protein [Chlorobiales bacterium]